MTRNNVEALEPRVLLSAHGAGTAHEPQGRAVGHDKGVETVELDAPQGSTDLTVSSDQNATLSQDTTTQTTTDAPTTTTTTASDLPEAHPLTQHGPNFILPFPGGSQEQQSGPDDPTQSLSGPESPATITGPQPGGWLSSQLNNPMAGDSGSVSGTSDNLTGLPGAGDTTISGITTGPGGVTVIDIILVNPITVFPTGSDSPPTGQHPLNNGGSDSNTDPGQWTGSKSGETQQTTQGNNSSQTGTGKTPAPSNAGNQSTPPTQQGSDSESSDSHQPQGHPLIQRGNGAPPPVFDPQQNSGGAGSVTTPTPSQVPFGPVARVVAPVADSTAAAAVTPLALTPAHGSSAASQATAAGTSALSIVTVAHDSVAAAKSAAVEGSFSVRFPMQLAAVMPPGSAIGKAIDAAVPAAARAVAQQIQTAGAVVTGVEAVTADALVQSLPAQATYNFIRFDPASFQDAMAAFANELASIAKPAASRHSTTRAWIITGTVLGLDTVFLSYWRLKTRKQKKSRLALARAVAKPGRRD